MRSQCHVERGIAACNLSFRGAQICGYWLVDRSMETILPHLYHYAPAGISGIGSAAYRMFAMTLNPTLSRRHRFPSGNAIVLRHGDHCRHGPTKVLAPCYTLHPIPQPGTCPRMCKATSASRIGASMTWVLSLECQSHRDESLVTFQSSSQKLSRSF